MPEKKSDSPSKGLLLLIGSLVVLVGAGIGLYSGLGPENQKAPKEYSGPGVAAKDQGNISFKERGRIPSASRSENLINFNQLHLDEDLNAMIRERKQEFGMDKGVDMIVQAEESFRIGESTVSMQEILDKIRLKKGDLVEDNLTAGPVISKNPTEERKRIQKEVIQISRRVNELNHLLRQPGIDKTTKAACADEQAKLATILDAYDNYLGVLGSIEDNRKLLDARVSEEPESVRARLEKLQIQKEQLENRLKWYLFPEESAKAFGIYVVKPEDNIWNIHFRFLKEYFENNDVKLSPVADEPTSSGYSSGVGKILKFSENMVHIYNLRNHALDGNLDSIHPLSKIVVFHMEKIFSVLDQIDYNNVEQVQFDGENLWLPAEG